MESDFCPVWPPYEVTDDAGGRLAGAVRATLRPFGASIRAEQIDAALQRCAQKLCVRRRSRTARSTSSRRARAPAATGRTRHARRRRAPPRRAPPARAPTSAPSSIRLARVGLLRRAEREQLRGGDRRRRLQRPVHSHPLAHGAAAARRAARHEPALHTEFVLCANETPVNAGGWCLDGPQPVFAPTSNEEHPLIAFPHWMPKLRDYDFSVWTRRAPCSAAAPTRWRASRLTLDEPPPCTAAACTAQRLLDEWRTRGVRRTDVNRSTWRHVGRRRCSTRAPTTRRAT